MAGSDWIVPVVGLWAFYKLAGGFASAGETPSDWGPYTGGSWVGPAQSALAAADPAKYTTTLPSGATLFHPGAPSYGPYGGMGQFQGLYRHL